MSGTHVNMLFEHVMAVAHSAFTELPSWYCQQSLSANVGLRFGLDASFGCKLPFGVPSRIVGGDCHHDSGAHNCADLTDASYNFTNIVFTNVTVNGSGFFDLLTRPELRGATLLWGNLFDFVVDGEQYNLPPPPLAPPPR